jgi:hypothetical protein
MQRPGAKRIAITGALGLLAGVGGAALCSGIFCAAYHPHGGGQIGDWATLLVAIVSFIVGPVVGLLAGVAWSFSTRPRWQLAAGLGAAGLVTGVIVQSVLR